MGSGGGRARFQGLVLASSGAWRRSDEVGGLEA